MKRLISFSLLLILVLAGCGLDTKIPNALNYKLEDFEYTNQDNKPYGLKDLKGKVWVADFIFTNCETVCPPMTANMAKLQKMAKEEDLDVHFVSFSVDPTVDKPAVMKAYVEKFTDDLKNWHLLTGYSQEEIERFAKENFRTLVDKPDTVDQVTHATTFFLVDQNGTVMKSYGGVSNTPYKDMIRDMKRLLR